MANGQPPLSVDEFAAKIKAKYPEYAEVDNRELTDRIVAKYPEYKEQVQLEAPKKKDGGGASGSEAPSTSKGEPGGPMVGQGTGADGPFTWKPTDPPKSEKATPVKHDTYTDVHGEIDVTDSPVRFDEVRQVGQQNVEQAKSKFEEAKKVLDGRMEPMAEGEGYQWSTGQGEYVQPPTQGAYATSVRKQIEPETEEQLREQVAKLKGFANVDNPDKLVLVRKEDHQPFAFDDAKDALNSRSLELYEKGWDGLDTWQQARVHGNILNEFMDAEQYALNFPDEAAKVGFPVSDDVLRAYEDMTGTRYGQDPGTYGLASFQRGVVNSVGQVLQYGEMIMRGGIDPRAKLIKQVEDPKGERTVGKQMQEWAQEVFPNDPVKQEAFEYKLLEGAGSMAMYMAAGGVSGVAPFVLGAMQNGAAMYNDAIESGASPDEAWGALMIGSAAGASEGFPISRFFNRINKASGGALKYRVLPAISGRVSNAFAQGIEEGMQEFAVDIANNLTAQQLYDASREIISDESIESLKIGAVLGVIMGGAINPNAYQGEDSKLAKKAKDNFTSLADKGDPEFKEKMQEFGQEWGEMTGNKIEAPESVQKEKPEPTTQEPEKTSQAQGEAVETPKSKQDEVQEQEKQSEEEVKPEKEQAETEAKEEGVLEEPSKKGGEDAIQERKTEEVPVQPETESSEEVRQAQPEKIQQAQEEVTDAEQQVKKLEKETTKLQSQLEKNLTENQGKMFDEGTEQSLFDDRAEQQKLVDEKQKELEGAREDLKKAQEKLQRVSDAEGQMEIEQKPTEDVEGTDKEGFTESEDLNRIFAASKEKYGQKKGGKYNEAAERLVNPNTNTIIEVKSNGVVVKEGDKYSFKPFTNTDANYKKWTLGRSVDVTEQYAPSVSEKSKPQEPISEKETQTPTEPKKTSPAKGEAAKTDKLDRLAELKNQYNALSPAKKKSKEGRNLMQTIMQGVGQTDTKIERLKGGKISIVNEAGKEVRRTPTDIKEEPVTDDQKKVALDLIDRGILLGIGEASLRTDLEMSTKEVQQAEKNLREGKDTKAARRLVQRLNEINERGEVPTIEGSGGNAVRSGYPLEWLEGASQETMSEVEKDTDERSTSVAEELTDDQVGAVNEYLEQFVDEDGTLDMQALEADLDRAIEEWDARVLNLPLTGIEEFKTYINERANDSGKKTADQKRDEGGDETQPPKSRGTDAKGRTQAQEQKGLVPVRFKRLGEEMEGTFDGSDVTSESGTVYPLSGVKDLEATEGHLKDPIAQKYGYENIHEAVNSAKKRLGKDVTPESITQKQIEDAAVESGRTPEGLTELDVSKKDNFDKAIDYLKGLEEKLDKFGKENMSGTIIPVPIFKMAVTTIRKGVEAGKTIKEALQDAWKAIKDTKWYKGLTADERNEALDNFTSRLNDDFTGRVPVSKTATQKKIDKETGVTKERTKITVNEMTSIKDQIRLEARAARAGEKSYKEAQKAFGQRVKDLLKPFSDRLTPAQAKSIVNGALRVNFKNPQITQRYLDYVGRVLQDAEYAGKLAEAKKKAKGARKNIKAGKLGQIAESNPIVQLMAVDPSIVPLEQIDNYLGVANEVGARKSVLPLSEKNALTERASEVMGAVEAENSLIDSLAETYEGYENKQDTYGETLKAMLNDGVITAEEYDLMRERKGDIVEKAQKEERSEEEIQQEIDEAVEGVMEAKKQLPARNNQLSLEENKLITFFNTITKEDLGRLTLADVNRVGGVMDNISNGHVPHLAEKLREKVEGKRDAHKAFPAIEGYKGSWVNWVSGAKAGLKNLFNANTTTIKEKIRRNPLLYIDQAIRNFKNTSIYEAIFEEPASALGQLNLRSQAITDRLRRASEKLGNDSRKAFDSAARIQFYLIQKEHDTNPDSKETMPLADRLQATIDGKDSIYDKRSKERLQELFNEHADAEGNYDADAAYDAMSKREKEVIDELRNIYDGVRFEADYTASTIRGNRIVPRDNYVHIPRAVRGTASQKELDITKQRLLNPSTKAGALQQRTQKASPTIFDPFFAANKSTKETLLDYYLTPAVKTSRQAINELDKLAETQGEIDVVNGIRDVFNETLEVAVGANVFMENIPDKVANELIKKGYQAILAGFDRSIVEFGSNFTFGAIYSPSQMMEGIKTMTSGNSDQLGQMVLSVGSTQADRLYGIPNMISKNVDFSRVSIIELQRLTGYSSEVLNTLKKAAIPAEKGYRGVDKVASFLVTKPDQWVARPMWHGQFNQEFMALTNTEPDVAKIANKDQDYMIKYGEAIEAARIKADRLVAESVASNNPFEGIARNQIAPSRNVVAAVYNAFKGFMTRFPTFEYNSALRAVHGMVGNGMLTRAEGTRLLAATMIRMSIYSAFVGTILKLSYNAAMMAIGGDPYDDERDEDFQTQSTNSILRAVVTLALQRNLGNWTKIPVNFGVEYLNKEYGEGITYKGEYDAFKDNVVYPIVPMEPSHKPLATQIAIGASGPMSPHVRTVTRGLEAIDYRLKSKKPETKKKWERELTERIPFEVLGNFGYVPFYRDVRKLYLMDKYKNFEEKAKKAKRDTGGREFKSREKEGRNIEGGGRDIQNR